MNENFTQYLTLNQKLQDSASSINDQILQLQQLTSQYSEQKEEIEKKKEELKEDKRNWKEQSALLEADIKSKQESLAKAITDYEEAKKASVLAEKSVASTCKRLYLDPLTKKEAKQLSALCGDLCIKSREAENTLFQKHATYRTIERDLKNLVQKYNKSAQSISDKESDIKTAEQKNLELRTKIRNMFNVYMDAITSYNYLGEQISQLTGAEFTPVKVDGNFVQPFEVQLPEVEQAEE